MKNLFVSSAVCMILAIGSLTSCCVGIDCGPVCRKDCGRGTCSEVGDSCVCVTGYETNAMGKCDSISLAKFLGVYIQVSQCTIPTGGPFTDTLTIVESNAGIDKVLINNYGGFAGLNALATVSGNTVSVTAADYTANGHTYGVKAASGTLTGISFTFSYKVEVDGVIGSDCIGVYTKQ